MTLRERLGIARDLSGGALRRLTGPAIAAMLALAPGGAWGAGACGANIVVCSHAGSYGDITGASMSAARAKLSNSAYFGPSGSLAPETFSYVSLSTITDATLTANNCQIYISGWDTPSEIDASEQAALSTWVNASSDRYVMGGCDNSGYDAVCQAMGRPTTNYSNVPVNLVAASPLNPLQCSGATTAETAGGASGYFASIGGDSVLSRYNDGSAFPQTITDSLTGGGKYLLTADIDMWMDTNSQVSAGSGISLSNDYFIVNTFRFAADNICGRVGSSGPICPGSTTPSDYGDAPSSYGSPSHAIGSATFRMGATVPDSEASPQTSASADGDDTDGTDDEDGVTIPALTAGVSDTIPVSVIQPSANSGYLQAWIDWNDNGDFADAGEQIAADLQYASGTSGTINISVSVPVDAVAGETIARFRWSSTAGLDATTAANYGEVEDHPVTIASSAAALVVTSTADTDTFGTLRYAINHANTVAGDDAITFNISGAGPHVISLGSDLPDLTDTGISIDGSTQPGASCGQLTTGTPHDLRIMIDGNGAATSNPLTIDGDAITVRGLSIVNTGNRGLFFSTTATNGTGECLHVGMEPDGTTANAVNRVGGGGAIDVQGASGSLIHNNLISGNDVTFGTDGIRIDGSATNTTVTGNIIGLDETGTLARPNEDAGIVVDSGTVTILIGGTTAATRNVISGNGNDGIRLRQTATGITVLGNYVGLRRDGTAAVGNGGDGIDLQNDTTGNMIGDGTSDGANHVSGNGASGIRMAGTSQAAIIGNAIYGNNAEGIELLGVNGADPNDSGDTDTGPNGLMNFPVLNQITADGSTSVGYDFDIDVSNMGLVGHRIEFFSNSAADPSGHGEGEIFLGHVDITSHGDTNHTGSFTAASPVSPGDIITATATSWSGFFFQETSEFSAAITAFTANPAVLAAAKTVSVVDDGLVNGDDTAAIPGATLRYVITVQNTGAGAADADATVIVDSIPGNGALKVTDFGGIGGTGPVNFVDGSPSSGLSYSFVSLASGADDLDFSDDNAASWTYTPVDAGDGTDPNVTHIRITPSGSFNPNAGTPPIAGIRYDVLLF